jgi:shikimate kinase
LLKQGNPRARLAELLAVRYPVYAEADITVTTGDAPIEGTVTRIVDALKSFQRVQAQGA